MLCSGCSLCIPPVLFEELQGVLYVYDYLASVLDDCVSDDGVLVALGGGVGASEDIADALQAVDVAVVPCFGTGVLAGLFADGVHEFLEVADCEGGDGGGVIDYHCFAF